MSLGQSDPPFIGRLPVRLVIQGERDAAVGLRLVYWSAAGVVDSVVAEPGWVCGPAFTASSRGQRALILDTAWDWV